MVVGRFGETNKASIFTKDRSKAIPQQRKDIGVT